MNTKGIEKKYCFKHLENLVWNIIIILSDDIVQNLGKEVSLNYDFRNDAENGAFVIYKIMSKQSNRIKHLHKY